MVLETHSGGYYNAPKDMGKYSQEVALFRGWDNNKSLHTNFKLVEKELKIPPDALKKPKPNSKSNSKPKSKSKSKKKKSSKKSPSNQYYKKFVNNTKIVDIFSK